MKTETPTWLVGIEGEAARELIESNAPLIRVVAGPGSGKTTCLKSRTQRLVQGEGIEPKKIFVGSFTRAVTHELQVALGTEIIVSTLHAYARSLLQKHSAARQGFVLRFLLEFEQDALLYDIDNEDSFSPVGDIYKLRKELRAVQSSRAQRGEYKDAAFAGAVSRWMNKYRAMPIGEVVHLCLMGLECGDIPNGMFDHVVIDEYQDLTIAEQELVQFLWSRKGSLTILGDDDQSIYGFRFNNPKGISNFANDWPDLRCREFTFSENRRCGHQILHIANLMMVEAGSKKPPMVPKSGHQGDLAFVRWDNVDDEVRGLARYIKSKPDERILVLVPRRFIGNLLAEAIGSEAKTMFREEVLEHQIAQEAFTAACLIANPDDPVTVRAWLGFHGTDRKQGNRRNAKAYSSLPSDIEGRKLIDRIASGEIKGSGEGKYSIKNRAVKAQELLELNLEPVEVIEFLFDQTNAINEENIERRRWLESDLLEIRVAALSMLEHQEIQDLYKTLNLLRYRIATRAPLMHDDTDHRIRIMTLHSAKGLEEENVVIAGAANQLLPSEISDEEERAEQKRLLYVAITRAKKSLVVSWPQCIRYSHMKRYGGKIELGNVFTHRNEKWVTTSRSSLLPQRLTNVFHGNIWLENAL